MKASHRIGYIVLLSLCFSGPFFAFDYMKELKWPWWSSGVISMTSALCVVIGGFILARVMVDFHD